MLHGPSHLTAIALCVVLVALTIFRLFGAGKASAGRRIVSPAAAATALSGEYLSGALLATVASAVAAHGLGMAWPALGCVAGFVVSLVLVAAPLRRSGAYTLSDFTEWRLRSRKVRRVTSASVCFFAWAYLIPQFHGAVATARAIGCPAWLALALVAGTGVALCLPKDPAGRTAAQAGQFWFKLITLAVAVSALLIAGMAHGAATKRASDGPGEHEMRASRPVTVRLDRPTVMWVDGGVDGVRRHHARVTLPAGRHKLDAGTTVRSAKGRVAALDSDRPHPLYATASVLAAMMLGSIGLPLAVVRLHTLPTGGDARRAVLWSTPLITVGLALAVGLGLSARAAVPPPLILGHYESAMRSALSIAPSGGVTGGITGVLVAGAFCAFLTASAAMVLVVGATIAQCMLGGGPRSYRIGVLIAISVPLAAVCVGHVGGTVSIQSSFAIAAGSLCPLLVFGVWQPGLTDVGAAAGMIGGGGFAAACVALDTAGVRGHGWWAATVAHPGLLAGALGFAVMWGASRLTPRRCPDGVPAIMTRMHRPERPGPPR